MKRYKLSIAFFLLLVLIGGGCDQSSQPQGKTMAAQSQTPTVPSARPSVVADPVDPIQSFVFPQEDTMAWPFLASDQKGDTIASDLLAKSYVVIYDGSGSMTEAACQDPRRSKHAVAKEAVAEWLKTIPAGANVGSVIFVNGRFITIMPADNASQPIIQAINNVSPSSGTPLATAIKKAYTMLTLQAQKQLGYGEYYIVVLTDGKNNDENEYLDRWVNRLLKESPVQLYTIGFCIGSGHDLNDPKRTVYREAGNLKEIRQGLAEVLAEAETFNVTSFPNK